MLPFVDDLKICVRYEVLECFVSCVECTHTGCTVDKVGSCDVA